jgi:hypothetical protein
MGRVLETSDPATLLASLARNIPGAIYRCALDRGWTMQLIGEETARGLNDLRDLARGIHPCCSPPAPRGTMFLATLRPTIGR